MGTTTVVKICKEIDEICKENFLNVQINKNHKHFMLSRSNSTNKAQNEKTATKDFLKI